MKLWEVIKALTEDPTKKFELSDRGSRERIESDGNYLRYSRIAHGMVSDPALERNVDLNNNDWQLVRQPVTWQEAIQAWADGKTVTCKTGITEKFALERYDISIDISHDQITNGIWYVED